MSIVYTAIISTSGVLLSALLGYFASTRHSKKQAEQELRSLIIAFCAEFVFAFDRCVGYYDQWRKEDISYSALLSLTDATTLSKFASVCKNPDIVGAIVSLKSHYYQISRHVDEISGILLRRRQMVDHIPESAVHELQAEEGELHDSARDAQETTLAFFHEHYKDIEKNTSVIVNETKRQVPSPFAEELTAKFHKQSQKYRELKKSGK